jgi:predicted peptidase
MLLKIRKEIILFLIISFLSGCGTDIIVTKPGKRLAKYPLVIYHYGGGYKKIEPFELKEISRALSEAGFLVWIPKRKPLSIDETKGALSKAEATCEKILDKALKDPMIDKDNINVIGFCLSSWAVFKKNLHSPHIKSIILLDFGAPFDDDSLYNKIYGLVNNTDYTRVSAKILVIVSKEDDKLSIEPAEIMREKMVEAKNKIDCIEYLDGNEFYLKDVVKYLKGENIDTVESIKLNIQHLERWIRIRKTGYW